MSSMHLAMPDDELESNSLTSMSVLSEDLPGRIPARQERSSTSIRINGVFGSRRARLEKLTRAKNRGKERSRDLMRRAGLLRKRLILEWGWSVG
jgi:hypothetical protein